MTRNNVMITAIAAGLLLMATGSANAQSSIQFSNMHDFESGSDLAGGGSLTRSENQVWAQLSMSGLDKKAAYTMWWVVFNNPLECEAPPCGLDDLETPAVEASILWATGFVTGTDGTANVSAHLDALNAPDGAQVLLGLEHRLNQGNGFDAEIHMIVRSHGKYDVGNVDQQIGSVSGSCGDAPDFPLCEDQQAIMFLATP